MCVCFAFSHYSLFLSSEDDFKNISVCCRSTVEQQLRLASNPVTGGVNSYLTYDLHELKDVLAVQEAEDVEEAEESRRTAVGSQGPRRVHRLGEHLFRTHPVVDDFTPSFSFTSDHRYVFLFPVVLVLLMMVLEESPLRPPPASSVCVSSPRI